MSGLPTHSGLYENDYCLGSKLTAKDSTVSYSVGQITMTLNVSWITEECSHAKTAVRHSHPMDFIIPTANCASTAHDRQCTHFT